MAFVRAKIFTKPLASGINVGLVLTRKRVSHSDAEMRFTMSDAIATQLNLTKSGDKLEVLIGTDEDHGLIRMQKRIDGQVVVTRKTGKKIYYQFSLGHQPLFVNRPEVCKWCDYKMMDGFIEVVLPKWAAETGPKAKWDIPPLPQGTGMTPKQITPIPPVAPVASHPKIYTPPAPPPPKHNVTSDLMGDPPPGRRELVERLGTAKTHR